MYLSMLLALMAFAGWLANPFTVLLALAFIPLITRVQILPEERALTARFGQPYRAYCARVKRWV
jgi:protein-S-isoprenylcysteine O-methyltransferase Ste14